MPAQTPAPSTLSAHRNEVLLVGRLAADPEPVELPSGDVVVTARLVVERPRPTAPTGRALVDTLDCAAWSAGLRRTVGRWGAGDVVEVSGSLRRRFWRAQGVPQSRYEVELTRARRLSRATA